MNIYGIYGIITKCIKISKNIKCQIYISNAHCKNDKELENKYNEM